MRKILIGMILISIFSLLCSCSKQNDNSPITATVEVIEQAEMTADNDAINGVEGNETEAPTTGQAVDEEVENPVAMPEEQEIYYGTWEIGELYRTYNISALDPDEYKTLVGKEIIYSSDYAIYEDNICMNPTYEIEVYTKEEFAILVITSFESIGIDAATLQDISIKTDSGDFWESIGNNFIIKDEDTLITSYLGGFIELKRKSQDK